MRSLSILIVAFGWPQPLSLWARWFKVHGWASMKRWICPGAGCFKDTQA